MAYTDPSADDLQEAFPRFAEVADETVEFWLTRARRQVDESWTEGDYAMGQMLLACHLMVTNGIGGGADAEAAAAGAGSFKRIKSASFELERFGSSDGAADSYSSTSYGIQFKELLRQNKGGPRVAPTGALPYPGGHYVDGGA